MLTITKALKQTAYELLREDISSGKIPIGTRIIEAEFTKRYNVSRTPVRYAIQKLEREGFLETLPQGGIYVTIPLLRDIQEYSNIHISILQLILKHAVCHVTQDALSALYACAEEIETRVQQSGVEDRALPGLCDKIHGIILSHCDLPEMVQMVESLPDYWRFGCIKPYMDKELLRQTYIQHRSIIDALRDRDADRLCRLYREHYQMSSNNRQLAYRKMCAAMQTGTNLTL